MSVCECVCLCVCVCVKVLNVLYGDISSEIVPLWGRKLEVSPTGAPYGDMGQKHPKTCFESIDFSFKGNFVTVLCQENKFSWLSR